LIFRYYYTQAEIFYEKNQLFNAFIENKSEVAFFGQKMSINIPKPDLSFGVVCHLNHDICEQKINFFVLSSLEKFRLMHAAFFDVLHDFDRSPNCFPCTCVKTKLCPILQISDCYS